jgi:uncharacterized membrane protein (UPF0127 family)
VIILRATLCVFLCLTGMAHAQTASYGVQTNPLIFERQTITLIPQGDTAQPSANSPLSGPPAPRVGAQFNVEVRSEEALKLEYIHSLNTLQDNTGVMIAFSAPTLAPLPFMRVYTALDVLFVADDGTILQIYPGHVPATTTTEVLAEQPIRALIYLKSGRVAALDIKPHDRIQSSLFTPPPPLLR